VQRAGLGSGASEGPKLHSINDFRGLSVPEYGTRPTRLVAATYASPGGSGLVELAFSKKTDAVKLAVEIGAPSVGFARPYSHIGHLPVRSIERFDLDRVVRQFRSALAIRRFYEFLRDTQLGPGHPKKQRDHRGFMAVPA
jgi:hypothetical protein